MGSRIAAHFAGIGLPVLLLDILPNDLPADAKPAQRNKIVNDALATAIKSNPSPVYHKDVIKKITTGNFTDNMKDIASADWIIDFLMHYGDLYLGKTTVLCKDSPAFIANRIGVFGMMAIMNAMEKLQLSIDEIDALTGPVIGRPKSATFRTADVVGIDTLVKVAKGLAENVPDDEAKHLFVVPAWLDRITNNNWLGDKSGQGFFKKVKGG